jgi:hypothetical protein
VGVHLASSIAACEKKGADGGGGDEAADRHHMARIPRPTPPTAGWSRRKRAPNPASRFMPLLTVLAVARKLQAARVRWALRGPAQQNHGSKGNRGLYRRHHAIGVFDTREKP